MLRRVALALAIGFGLMAPAFAADAPRPIIVPPPVVVKKNPFDGFYLGGHVGYGWGNRQGCFAIFQFPAPHECDEPVRALRLNVACFNQCQDDYAFPFDYDQRGWLAGGQVGFNKVLGAGGLLVGAEVTASLSGISGILHLGDGGGSPFDGVGTYPWLGTATAKIGWTGGNWMVYAEGGIGLAGFNYRSGSCSFDSVNQGLVWGVGGEVAIKNNNSLFIEWNRFNFEGKDAACSFTFYGFTVPVGVYTKPTLDVVRVGFNHYFN
jgi:opacity protein-like surface antigen